MQPAQLRLVLLALGAFTVGTDAYLVAGLLPQIAEDLSVPVATAGQLVSFFAIAYAVAAPLMSFATRRFNARTVLVAALCGVALTDLALVVASTYPMLAVGRLVTACFAAAFTPTAASVAASLVPPDRQGRALAYVPGGMTLATALGVPLGSLIANVAGWRGAFVFVSVLSGIVALGLWRTFGHVQPQQRPDRGERLVVLRKPAIWSMVGMTVLWFTGGFMAYTYISQIAAEIANVHGGWLTAVLLTFGVAAIVGVRLGGVGADLWGPRRTLVASVGGKGVAFLALAVTGWLAPGPLNAVVILFVVVAFWSVSAWATNAPQQRMFITRAPEDRVTALSLASSANYAGITLGASLGGLVISSYGAGPVLTIAAGIEFFVAAALITGGIAARRRAVREVAARQAELAGPRELV
ncbi:MFS transporter [Saccharopolyspora taberi]|uniref:MFS transporter n=1 Tax=Saccharopolyspora taberi TaxID=60895 RepID=A0ABN3V7D4_9PSEU